MFVTYIVYSKLYNIYKEVWNTKKYAPYIRDTNEGQQPFQNYENRNDQLEKIINDVDFQVETCKIESVSITGERNAMKDLLLSINLVYDQIPKELQEESLKDHLNEIDQVIDSKIKLNSDIFIVCAVKNE
ncbi:hypothetical protein FQA39_LY01669 [Lamprigera yunnana]|nr:hypothetical protein FQA39_LY01669 [Lamprigera yunnana]